jgi:hypothetical protein
MSRTHGLHGKCRESVLVSSPAANIELIGMALGLNTKYSSGQYDKKQTFLRIHDVTSILVFFGISLSPVVRARDVPNEGISRNTLIFHDYLSIRMAENRLSSVSVSTELSRRILEL